VLKNPILIGALESLEMLLYKNARHIVVVADAMRDKLVSRGVPAEKISVVPNGVDPLFFSPTPKGRQVKKQNDWDGKFIAMYIGTLGLSQGLDTLLDAATILAKRDPEVLIVLAGAGAERERLMALKEKRALGNVEFIAAQPKERMPAMYCAADCCIVPLKNLDVFKHTIPSKMFEVMSCARPIILGVEGQSKTVLEESGAGVCITPEDANALAGAILRLKSDPKLCEQLGDSGRAYVREKYTRESLAANYLAILENLPQ